MRPYDLDQVSHDQSIDFPDLPAMVFAAEDTDRSSLLLYHWESSVSAGIVEAMYPVVAVLGHHKIEAGNLVSQEVAGLLNARFVGDEHPFPREDRSPLKAVHLI